MKTRYALLACLGSIAIVFNLMVLTVCILNLAASFAPELYALYIGDLAFSILELAAGGVMFLYLFGSILIDRELKSKRRALAAWGISLLITTVAGIVFSGIIKAYDAMPFLIMAVFALAVVSIILNAWWISEKGNSLFHLLASILLTIYVPFCCYAIFALDEPMAASLAILITAPLFSIHVILDLLYYRGVKLREKQQAGA